MSESKKVLYDLADVKKVFGGDIEDFCTVEFVDHTCLLKPKAYLGDAWKDLNDKVKSCGGHWVSAGKESHWKIPLETKGSKKPEKAFKHEITESIAAIRNACDVLESCMHD